MALGLELRELMQELVQQFQREIQQSNNQAIVEFVKGPEFVDPAEVHLFCSVTKRNIGYSYSVAAHTELKRQRAQQSATAKQKRIDECDNQSGKKADLVITRVIILNWFELEGSKS